MSEQMDPKFAGLDQTTFNKFLVGIRREEIVIQRQPAQPMTKDDALRLALWLVMLADDRFGKEGGKFHAMLQFVKGQ